jgi:hypothetical protein
MRQRRKSAMPPSTDWSLHGIYKPEELHMENLRLQCDCPDCPAVSKLLHSLRELWAMVDSLDAALERCRKHA